MFYTWFNDSDSTKFFLKNWQESFSQDEIDAWITKKLAAKRIMNLMIHDDSQRKYIGYCGLTISKDEEGTVGIFIYIGDMESRSRGYGLATMRQLIHYGFNNLGMKKIKARVFESNIPAQRLCERVGFVKVDKLLNAIYREREWRNKIVYELKNPNFSS